MIIHACDIQVIIDSYDTSTVINITWCRSKMEQFKPLEPLSLEGNLSENWQR